jgi:hypothetical protein
LVLAPNVRRALVELAGRARHRDTVLAEWRMRRGGGRGGGVTALFAGDSGTGKTMSSEVIAGDLGLDLYWSTSRPWSTSTSAKPRRISKDLRRWPAECNAVLFFDEADAIFGKRSDVSAPSPSVQRDAAEEEPPVQGMFVQRQDEDERKPGSGASRAARRVRKRRKRRLPHNFARVHPTFAVSGWLTSVFAAHSDPRLPS